MWPFSKGYDMKVEKFQKLQEALKDSRDVQIDPKILQRVKLLAQEKDMTGQYMFGHDDGKIIVVEDVERMKSTRASPSQLVIDFTYFLETVEDMERQQLRYLGAWFSKPGFKSKGVSNADVLAVQHPNNHLEDRLYVIGIVNDNSLEVSLAKSFIEPKKVKIGKIVVQFEGYSYMQKKFDLS